jgi:hypothetical protein
MSHLAPSMRVSREQLAAMAYGFFQLGRKARSEAETLLEQVHDEMSARKPPSRHLNRLDDVIGLLIHQAALRDSSPPYQLNPRGGVSRTQAVLMLKKLRDDMAEELFSQYIDRMADVLALLAEEAEQDSCLAVIHQLLQAAAPRYVVTVEPEACTAHPAAAAAGLD